VRICAGVLVEEYVTGKREARGARRKLGSGLAAGAGSRAFVMLPQKRHRQKEKEAAKKKRVETNRGGERERGDRRRDM
jgi:hypothetical protein